VHRHVEALARLHVAGAEWPDLHLHLLERVREWRDDAGVAETATPSAASARTRIRIERMSGSLDDG
jgi:hypothetical protein